MADNRSNFNLKSDGKRLLGQYFERTLKKIRHQRIKTFRNLEITGRRYQTIYN